MPIGGIRGTRRSVEADTNKEKERNRLWWERMPMSYADWHDDDRIPDDIQKFLEIERYLLSRSPFLTAFFEERRFDSQRVLDLGSGSGVLSCLLARQGAKVTAVDITDQGVRLSAENAKLQQADVSVVRSDAEALGLKTRSFDYVFSWGVVHHSPKTENALVEIARILKPGGRGILMVYHRNSIVYYLRGLWWLLMRGKIFRGYNLETIQDLFVDGYYHRHFSGTELTKCLETAGLSNITVSATQQDEPILPMLPQPIDNWLKKKFGWYLVAEFEAGG